MTWGEIFAYVAIILVCMLIIAGVELLIGAA
jgi:hypothetical protein